MIQALNYLIGAAACAWVAIELVWMSAAPLTCDDTPMDELLAVGSDRG